MLRSILIGLTACLFALSLLLALWIGFASFWVLLLWLALLLAGLVFERVRYKTELAAPPGPDWVATEELTVDAGGAVRVWYHPRSGERAYVREQSGRVS